MSRFIVTLSDEERARLEAIRSANGLRSQADAIRWLIFVEAGRTAPPDPAEVNRIAGAAVATLRDKLMMPRAALGSRLKKR